MDKDFDTMTEEELDEFYQSLKVDDPDPKKEAEKWEKYTKLIAKQRQRVEEVAKKLRVVKIDTQEDIRIKNAENKQMLRIIEQHHPMLAQLYKEAWMETDLDEQIKKFDKVLAELPEEVRKILRPILQAYYQKMTEAKEINEKTSEVITKAKKKLEEMGKLLRDLEKRKDKI